MKKIAFLIVFILGMSLSSKANNLVLGTPTISGSTITFSIKWDNSWKVSTGPSNWDAVWIFVKRQSASSNLSNWMHSTISSSSIAGTLLQVDAVGDQMGVFVRRTDGIMRAMQATNVTLTLPTAVGTDNIKVMGIEMVYVPQGPFYVGDGSSQNAMGNASNQPLLVNSALLSANSSGMPKAVYGGQYALGSSANLLSTFPFGYDGFYCMKYEITTQEYVGFLNTLNYNQQMALQDNPAVTKPESAIGTALNQKFGYKIAIKTPGIAADGQPAVYGNDATIDANFDQDNDGLGLPVALSLKEFLAFLSWTALRPMSEFEYEKSCRGPLQAVANEFAWGTTQINTFAPNDTYAVGNRFTPSETLNPGYVSTIGFTTVGRGLVSRAGITANNASDRVHASAAYYGILDMTGNVFEGCVGGWNFDYSTFTTANGNAVLDNDCLTNVAGWPQVINQFNAGQYFMYRGGSISWNGTGQATLSYRGGFQINDKNYGIGGRGVRSY